jgi:hypothetical protein
MDEKSLDEYLRGDGLEKKTLSKIHELVKPKNRINIKSKKIIKNLAAPQAI